MSETFEQWWDEFKAAHEEWKFADREALLFAAWQAGRDELRKGQEPVYKTNGSVLISAGNTQISFAGQEWVDLYLHPAPIPADMVLVPREPTEEMLDRAEEIDWGDSDVRGNCCNQWNAMIAAYEKEQGK